MIKSTEMGLVATKHVFGVSDIARIKQGSSATETSLKIENLFVHVASLDMLLSNNQITNVLIMIRLRVCAGWSVPLLFANFAHRRQVFSCRGPNSS